MLNSNIPMPIIPLVAGNDPDLYLVVDPKLLRPAGMYVQLANGANVELLDLFDEAAILHVETNSLEMRKGKRANWIKFAEQCNQRTKEQS